jgi:hypothetical protein
MPTIPTLIQRIGRQKPHDPLASERIQKIVQPLLTGFAPTNFHEPSRFMYSRKQLII